MASMRDRSARTISPSEDETSQTWKAGRQELMIIYSLALISMMVALDASIVVTALPYIARALSLSSTQSFWIGTSYVLANTICQLLVASLSNVFGRRQLYVPSIAVFAVGSIVAATAKSLTTILVGRSIQGVGGGGITAMTIVIITDIVPLRARPKYIAINSAAWAIGTILGPVLGGLLSQHSTWRWIFWLMLPFCGIGLVLAPLVIRLEPKETTLSEKLKSIDWVGSVLFVPSLTAFLVAISWGGSQYAWTSAATLVPLIFGAAGALMTIAWEFKFAKVPFFRRSLFRSTTSIVSYGGAMIQGLLLFGTLYALPLYFSAVKGQSATMSGVDLLPLLVAFVPASMVAGIFSTKLGQFRPVVWIGWAIATLGTGLIILFDANTSTAVWAVIQIICGFGQGFVLTGLNTATQASTLPEDAASAGSMYTFSRQLGTALGIPIVTSAFQNFMRRDLQMNGLAVNIAEDAVGYVAVLQQLQEGSEARQKLIHAYVAGVQGTFQVFTGLAGLGLLLSLLIKHFSMDQVHAAEHKLVRTRKYEDRTKLEVPQGKCSVSTASGPHVPPQSN